MNGSKLQDYLGGLTAYELNRFRKYMHSPLFNDDDRLKKFTDSVIELSKKQDWVEMEPTQLWRRSMGASPFNNGKYNRLLSDTVKKLEHFLIIDRFQQQPDVQRNYLLEIMNERKLLKHIPEFLSLAQRKLDDAPVRDADFLYRQLQLQQQKNLYLENKDQRSLEKNIQEVLRSADHHYFAEKLKYTAALLHYKNFLSVEGEVPLLPELLAYLQKNQTNIPAIEIYRYIILMFVEADNESHYKHLSSLSQKHQHLFPEQEKKNMLVFAMNYCIGKINFGRQQYLHELLQLYKRALADGLIMENGELSPWDYKNIVTTALRCSEGSWADEFIESYKPLLPRKERHNAYTFNRARLFFHFKKYDRVLELLQHVRYSDIFYQLDSKTTLLKTYYELGEELPLQSLKDSFRILLSRKRLISDQQRDNYMNLLKLTLKLFKVDVKQKNSLQALRTEITETQNVADKSWLLEKLAEISGTPD